MQKSKHTNNKNKSKLKPKKLKLNSINTYEDLIANWNKCNYLIKSKSRLCNMQRADGEMMCGHHLMLLNGGGGSVSGSGGSGSNTNIDVNMAYNVSS